MVAGSPHILGISNCDFMVLTIAKKLGIILNIERLFEYAAREAGIMVHSEMEVIQKIRNSKNPERAMQVATDIILSHLKRLESSQSRSAALPQGPCAAT